MSVALTIGNELNIAGLQTKITLHMNIRTYGFCGFVVVISRVMRKSERVGNLKDTV